MRYAIVFLVCGLCAWSILSRDEDPVFRAPEEEPIEQGVDVSPGGLPDDEETASLESLAVPAMSDPLAETIFDILKGLIEGDFGTTDRQTLEERLATTMLSEQLGLEDNLRSAARTAVDRMLLEAENARAAGASTGPMTTFQSQATVSLSSRFAGSLRRAMRASREGKVHEGPLLSVDFDFEVPEGYQKAGWEVIGGFRYVEGMELPASVRSLHQKKVGLAGYMMALGEFEDIHIFAVVESQWSCCFGTPPDIHQVIEVTLPDKAPGVELVPVPILVLGTLDVGEEVEDGWVVSVYRIQAESVDVLE